MELKDFFYIFSIVTTFAIGLANVVFNYKNSSRTQYINTITSERIKWINSIRENVSEFCGKARFLAYWGDESPDEKKDRIKELNYLFNLIRLQLNPKGEADQKIFNVLKAITGVASPNSVEAYCKKEEELVTLVQEYLKTEWDRVKKEAKVLEPEKGLKSLLKAYIKSLIQ